MKHDRNRRRHADRRKKKDISGYRSEEENRRRKAHSEWRKAMGAVGLFIVATIGAGVAGARFAVSMMGGD